MRIGILQTGHLPDAMIAETGDYDVLFRRLLDGRGLSFETFNVVDMEFPASVEDAEGWLVTGSRHGVYDALPFMAPLKRFLLDAMAAGQPVVGICFGHQILAEALGGRVEKAQAGWQVGAKAYAGDAPLRLNAWHQDQVLEPPAGADVIATHEGCPYAGLIYGDRALTLQAHPEFTSREVRELMEKRAPGVVPPERVAEAAGQLDAANDNDTAADLMARFFKERRIG